MYRIFWIFMCSAKVCCWKRKTPLKPSSSYAVSMRNQCGVLQPVVRVEHLRTVIVTFPASHYQSQINVTLTASAKHQLFNFDAQPHQCQTMPGHRHCRLQVVGYQKCHPSSQSSPQRLSLQIRPADCQNYPAQPVASDC